MKPYYALTMNGKAMAIVPSLAEAVTHIAACAFDMVDGKYVQGTIVGALLSIDHSGNRWSVKRVSAQSARMIEANRKRRHAKRLAEFCKVSG
jgi:hypothetical protein